MQLDLYSFSKIYDKEKLPSKKLELIVDWLEKNDFQVKFFLDNKNSTLKLKKSAFVKMESVDFSSLFSKSLKVDPIIDKDITMKGLQRIIKHI